LSAQWQSAVHNRDAYRLAAESGAPDLSALQASHQLADELDLAYLQGDAGPILGETLCGLQRVKRTVRDLLDFSRIDDGEWLNADLHQCLEDSLNMVLNVLQNKVRLHMEYGELPPISCRPGPLGQVFMNLLTNAAQSIAEHGTVTLRSGCEGEAVWVEVEDTGSGIAPEVLPNIFEPFFTTQPVGGGTGLGLAVSYGIVQEHNGQTAVRSTLGQGTTFRVTLPIRQEETVG
jgi:signal transduction histidine kinase